MAIVVTEGLVLRTYNLSEADKIVVVLTPRHGLIRGVAKGARRLKSRFGSTLEPCSVVGFEFYQKEDRELVTIRDAELIKSYFAHSPSPELFSTFSYFAEVLSLFAPPAEPNERLFKMSRVCIESLAADPQNRDALTLYFEIWVLKLGGFLPDWSRCGICDRRLEPDEASTVMFSYEVACTACRGEKGAETLTKEARTLFMLSQNTGPERFLEAAGGRPADVRAVSRVLKRIIEQIAGRRLAASDDLRTAVIDE